MGKLNKKYLLFSILLLLYAFMVELIFSYFSSTFDNMIYYSTLYVLRFTLLMGFGGMIGAESLLRNNSCNGKWRYNYKRTLVLGLPALLLSYYFYLIQIPLINSLLRNILPTLLLNGYYVKILSSILLGYIIVTSFNRQPKYESSSQKNR